MQDELRKHFTAAQVQATWQQRRRAASLDTLEMEESTVTRYSKAVVRSKIFLGVLTLLIFLHVILMGVEVDLAASTDAPLPDWFWYYQPCFGQLLRGRAVPEIRSLWLRDFLVWH